MVLWWLSKDGDSDLLQLYRRHYSCRGIGRLEQFVGPGENIVLRTERADAMFVWRRFIDDSNDEERFGDIAFALT